MRCNIKRYVKSTHHNLNLGTGESTYIGDAWTERECGTPLFTDEERKLGICKSCFKDWNVATNYSIDPRTPDNPYKSIHPSN